MRRLSLPFAAVLLLGGAALAPAQESSAPERAPSGLMEVMADELQLSMERLAAAGEIKPYFLAYSVADTSSVSITSRLGTIYADDARRRRILDVDLRVGDYSLDNTHKLRGRTRGGEFGRGGGGSASVPLEDEPLAVRHALWQATDRAYRDATEAYQQVQANLKTMVEEKEQADDFSREEAQSALEDAVALELDRAEWTRRLAEVSRLARDYPLIESSDVSLSGSAENRTLVTSEGARLRTGRELWRVVLSAGAKAEDGMELSQTFIFDAARAEGLPDVAAMRAEFQKVLEQVLALRAAPLVEPYTGPAILANRASGVFFHEIFGHRIEGHRQKDVEEGQTFTKMVGEAVLPEFMSVSDDPTRARLGDVDLRGHYRFDEEGMRASRVELVTDGILKGFLMCRSPVPGFAQSNGHGRRQPGRPVVARQGNLLIESRKAVPIERLRELLIEECQKQQKPYGYLFEDISGGFTMTTRGDPQAFKVLPIVVYRVHADGRPDELVRGVDIVGTPLSCFSKILCTGDDPAVFNGTCGAESGSVPVSAISPSILVEQIEIEKRAQSQERPPILPPPVSER